jgi:hypothetical protein
MNVQRDNSVFLNQYDVITGFLIILFLAYVKFVTGCIDVVLYEYSVDV